MERKAVVWLIPVLTLLYIAYANIQPFGGETSYFIDIGSEGDTTGDAKLTGPMERVSEQKVGENKTYRELNHSLVYFEIKSARLSDGEELIVRVKFKHNFPYKEKFKLGARNKEEWSYQWQEIPLPLNSSASVIGEAKWKVKDLYIKDNKLSLCFNTPHLAKEQYKNYTIPIDWVEIVIKTKPFWERL